MNHNAERRLALLGIGAAAGAAALANNGAKAAKASGVWIAGGAAGLKALHAKLDAAPRRRDFRTVPMTLENEDYWDHEALAELLAYRGGPKQIWIIRTSPGPGST